MKQGEYMDEILVTGSCGFIGFYVSKALLDLGYGVVGYDNMDDYYDVRLKKARLEILKSYKKFIFYEANICDAFSLEQVASLHNFEVVIHLAAQAGVRYSLLCPEKYIETNIVGTFQVLELCRKHKIGYLMYASSSSVYGDTKINKLSLDLKTDSPISLYAATKKSDEVLVHVYCNNFGLNAIGMRFFTVYGPLGRPDMAYYKFVDKILCGEPIQVYNFGKQYRDFTYIDDLVDGIIKLFIHGMKLQCNKGIYECYNLGSGNPVELMVFIETLEEIVGKKAIKQMCEKRIGDVEKTYADISDIQGVCDFYPKTCIKEGLEKFYNWYKEYHGCS